MEVPFNNQSEVERPLKVSAISKGLQMPFDLASAGITKVIAQNHGSDDAVLERAPETKQESKTKPKKPSLYKVLLHNDYTTPFDFVVHVLKKHFDVPLSHASNLMIEAHNTGLSVVVVYSKEIAEAKVETVNNYCRSQENPVFNTPIELRFSCEKE